MKIRSCFTVAAFIILLPGLCVTVAQTYSTWHDTLCFDLVAVGNLLQRLKGRAPDHHESCTPHIWSSLVTEGLIQATWNNTPCKGRTGAVRVLQREVKVCITSYMNIIAAT